uniref:phosphatidylethanolamine N-methyltransferase isoform X1 n=1 Tax=Callithrix jacchus TaxID=9483 RepID=UPI0023DD0150|nr:phosphatidylethanolamine N-methyltransferase isoform X1 [Callithrix jacchus]
MGVKGLGSREKPPWELPGCSISRRARVEAPNLPLPATAPSFRPSTFTWPQKLLPRKFSWPRDTSGGPFSPGVWSQPGRTAWDSGADGCACSWPVLRAHTAAMVLGSPAATRVHHCPRGSPVPATQTPRPPHSLPGVAQWEMVARWEHKTRKLSRAFGSPYLACYSLSITILLLNFLRSHCFTQAMLNQPRMESLDTPVAHCLGLMLLGVGVVLVLSSFFALGFTGTFLGDYFGILKEARVIVFPFSVLDNPMYWGSTANYLGWAILHASPTGLLLTVLVALTYMVALLYEEPFTAEIYRQKASGALKRS